MLKIFLSNIRKAVGVTEFLFLLGLCLLYFGSAAQFGHAVAQIVSGSVLVIVSLLTAFKGE